MNAREAILSAADYLERHPDEWGYWATHVPECGTPGCALGFIGREAGMAVGTPVWRVESEVLGIKWMDDIFYARMRMVQGHDWWSNSALSCAANLRAYADKYHPVEPLEFLPGAEVVRGFLPHISAVA